MLFATEGASASHSRRSSPQDLTAHHGGAAERRQRSLHRYEPGLHQGRPPSNLPEAAITFDKFHAVKIINEAVDHASDAPNRRTQTALRNTALHLADEQSRQPVAERQKAMLWTACRTHHLKTARAYQDPAGLSRTSTSSPPPQTAAGLHGRSGISGSPTAGSNPMIEAAHLIKRHWDGILRWFDSKIANGMIEGINSLVQAAKAKASGYRSTRNLKAMVYLLAVEAQASDSRLSPR